ncbi:MAG: WD40 repeat domain-containing protein [Salinarimonadaceae bacterium]|nr:MAG: WD40 repeat domain-containing protein [Salinarimonadaceae bacterium]
MTSTEAAQPSLASLVRPVEAGAHVTAIAFLGEVAAFALGDGDVLLWRDDAEHRAQAHPGGSVLCGAGDDERLVTGGDDGRVVVTGADGSTREFAKTAGAWIDCVALHHGGGVAWSAGRDVTSRDDKGREKSLQAPSSARGLCFAPKGYRLAIAHYNGATLWFPNLDAAPELLEWKGSHLDVVWSPDGRFVVTAMQENALHGWRLQPDKGHMRMSGYAAKPRSLSWCAEGKELATSGAEAAILWPFDSKEGPTGKRPREFGLRPMRVSQVACHPRLPIVAVGYEDGYLCLIRTIDGSELVVRSNTDAGRVTALAWDRKGQYLAFGCDDGAGGVLRLP